jgi:hypothetical protein
MTPVLVRAAVFVNARVTVNGASGARVAVSMTGVAVGVKVGVGGSGVKVGVLVAVGVWVGVGVFVTVGVEVGVEVEVLVGVGVGVEVGGLVGVLVAVAVAAARALAWLAWFTPIITMTNTVRITPTAMPRTIQVVCLSRVGNCRRVSGGMVQVRNKKLRDKKLEIRIKRQTANVFFGPTAAVGRV